MPPMISLTLASYCWASTAAPPPPLVAAAAAPPPPAYGRRDALFDLDNLVHRSRHGAVGPVLLEAGDQQHGQHQQDECSPQLARNADIVDLHGSFSSWTWKCKCAANARHATSDCVNSRPQAYASPGTALPSFSREKPAPRVLKVTRRPTRGSAAPGRTPENPSTTAQGLRGGARYRYKP